MLGSRSTELGLFAEEPETGPVCISCRSHLRRLKEFSQSGAGQNTSNGSNFICCCRAHFQFRDLSSARMDSACQAHNETQVDVRTDFFQRCRCLPRVLRGFPRVSGFTHASNFVVTILRATTAPLGGTSMHGCQSGRSTVQVFVTNVTIRDHRSIRDHRDVRNAVKAPLCGKVPTTQSIKLWTLRRLVSQPHEGLKWQLKLSPAHELR